MSDEIKLFFEDECKGDPLLSFPIKYQNHNAKQKKIFCDENWFHSFHVYLLYHRNAINICIKKNQDLVTSLYPCFSNLFFLIIFADSGSFEIMHASLKSGSTSEWVHYKTGLHKIGNKYFLLKKIMVWHIHLLFSTPNLRKLIIKEIPRIYIIMNFWMKTNYFIYR